MRPRACAAVLRGDSILMVQHNENGRTYWTLPGGGVEPGETAAQAAVRETHEETGIVATVVRFLFSEGYAHGTCDCYLLAATDDSDPLVGSDPEEAHLPDSERMLRQAAWRPLTEMIGDAQVAQVISTLKEPNQMAWNVQNENEAYVSLLMPHLGAIVANLRQIPPDQWDYAPAPPAPTPRILAAHTFQWLVCDRQHITLPDAATHPRVPEVPRDPALVCDMLEAESARWKALLLALTPEELASPRSQFNQFEMNVRAFVCHIIQNSIYKSGQLATLFFALGLDGTAPYEAPFPNPIYDDVFGPAID